MDKFKVVRKIVSDALIVVVNPHPHSASSRTSLLSCAPRGMTSEVWLYMFLKQLRKSNQNKTREIGRYFWTTLYTTTWYVNLYVTIFYFKKNNRKRKVTHGTYTLYAVGAYLALNKFTVAAEHGGIAPPSPKKNGRGKSPFPKKSLKIKEIKPYLTLMYNDSEILI